MPFSIIQAVITPSLLLLADSLILFTNITSLRFLAAMLLFFCLPGLALLQALNWLKTESLWERIVLAGAASFAGAALLILLAAYLPGALTTTQLLAIFNGLILALWLIAFLRRKTSHQPPCALRPDKYWPWLLALLLIAAVPRFYNLGYSEFREDELENMNSALRIVHGEDFVLFMDSKGPVQALIPAATWLLSGRISEGMARSPFAIASMLGIIAIFVAGKRFFNPGIGLGAAAVLAIHGYLVAFSRWVENPNFVLLLSVAALYCLQRYRKKEGQTFLLMASFLLGAALLTHWDVLPFYPAAAYLALEGWWRGYRHRAGVLGLAASLLLGLAILAVFYLPYILDPAFTNNMQYLLHDRSQAGQLHNRINRLMYYDNHFNGRFFFPTTIFLSLVALLKETRKAGRYWFWAHSLLILWMAAVPLLPSDTWMVGGLNTAFVPYLLSLILLLLMPHLTVEWRALVLWFYVPFGLYNFVIGSAADHTEIVFWGGSLLAAGGFAALWQLSRRPAWKGALALVFGSLAVATYGYTLFFYPTTVEAYGTLRDAANAPGSVSPIHAIYGPLPQISFKGGPWRQGWKAVGALYADKTLAGDFRTVDVSYKIPIWYAFDTPRSCYTDPANIFSTKQLAKGDLPNKKYRAAAVITEAGQPSIYAYVRENAPSSPHTYVSEELASRFDALATPQQFIGGEEPASPLRINFADLVQLQGYTLEKGTYHPGETVRLTLYWRALAATDVELRAFTHVEGTQLWAQHDEDPICRLKSTDWRPGQSGLREFRLNLAKETPPGSYPLVIGLYDGQTQKRLPAVDSAGQAIGDSVSLGEIVVQ